MKKIVSSLGAVLLAVASITAVSQPAFAAAPTLSDIFKTGTTQASGSVSGNYQVTVEGTGFCSGGTSDVTAVTIGDVALTGVAVTCGTPDSLVGTYPAQALADRAVGQFPVVVTTDAPSTTPLYFAFIPAVDATYAQIQQTELVQLGSLFSRTQRQPIVRSDSAPYTVSGIDSLTGEPYTYVTNYNYLRGEFYDDIAGLVTLDCLDSSSANYIIEACEAYTHEPDLGENVHPGSLDPVVLDDGIPAEDLVVTTGISATSLAGTSVGGGNSTLWDYDNNSWTISTANGDVSVSSWLGSRTVVELYSDLDCGPDTDLTDRADLDPDNLFDSGDGDGPKYTFCAGFGPDLYSEPFVATAGQSLAFEWAAIGDEDDYAVYAYLVKVDSGTGAIPSTADEENHELVLYSSGSYNGTSDWNTSTADVTESGTYRFRFINGSYDGTGGYKLGSLFYLSEVFLAGTTNEITFGPFDDQIVQPSDTFVIGASSDAGGEITVATLSPSVCTVASRSTTPPTYTVTVVSLDDTCILQASQGVVGQYAPAASVLGAIEFRTAATTPAAPTLVTVTPGDGQLTADWNAGPNGGSAITNYEYSTDNGVTWVAISPSSIDTDYTITGLDNGTTYDVKIRAVNAQGQGTASNMLQGTPNGSGGGTPAAPAPYAGPKVIAVDPDVPKPPAGKARFTGEKLDEITKVVIDGTEVEFEFKDGELILDLPPGIKPGLYDVTVSGSFGSLLVQQAVNVFGTVDNIDIGKKTWTNINSAKTSVRVIYKNPVGVGKVQFMLNGVEIAWVRAVDATDPKLRFYTLDGIEIPYLVRNVVLTPGIKNAFEIYVDGVRVWRAAYYSAD